MSSILKRLQSASGPVALGVALLAVTVSAAGIGYAAATIGTNDLQNNAVTAPKIKKNAVTTKKIKNNAVKSSKVKDGSITNADLVVEEKARLATLSNGGEGDCVWNSAAAVLPGYNTGLPTFRKDRQGVVRLSGIALSADAPGGDGDCNAGTAGQIADAIAFILPAGYIPATTVYTLSGGIIVGAQGATLPSGSLPPGAVFGSSVVLDGVTFDSAGSGVAIAKVKASGRYDDAALKRIGLG